MYSYNMQPLGVQPLGGLVRCTPSPPTKSSGFRGFDSSRLLVLRGGILMSVNFDRGSPGKFDSRTLNGETLNRWTGCIGMIVIIIVSVMFIFMFAIVISISMIIIISSSS